MIRRENSSLNAPESCHGRKSMIGVIFYLDDTNLSLDLELDVRVVR
jgi:hypothetical protein